MKIITTAMNPQNQEKIWLIGSTRLESNQPVQVRQITPASAYQTVIPHPTMVGSPRLFPLAQ